MSDADYLALTAPSSSVVEEVVETRRRLHRNPEVSFAEHDTSRFVRGRLAELGLEVLPCPTETGAVARLDSGRAGPTVMVRADIDALPIQEDLGLAFESTREGRMHACGHDAHTAIALGVARTLSEHAESLAGRFVFVFQPAEEIVQGAKAMIAQGLLQQNPCDYVVGLHTWAPMESGTIVAKPGVHWAGTDAFEIGFRGPGGHGGVMKRRGNVIGAQAFLVERLYSIVDGLEHDGGACHTSVGEVRSDGAYNVVPRSALLRGTVRTFTPELRAEALQRLRDLLLETETEFEIKASLDLKHSSVPLLNDARVTELVMDTARRLIGERASRLGRPLTVGDDIAEFMVHIPGCYFMLGCLPPARAEDPPIHHSPTFEIDEAAFQVGLRVLAAAAARLGAEGLPHDSGA